VSRLQVANDCIWQGHQRPGKSGTTHFHPIPRFTLTVLNAGFAPDFSRWHDEDGASEVDPEATFMASPADGLAGWEQTFAPAS
jgi:hypothetical protein